MLVNSTNDIPTPPPPSCPPPSASKNSRSYTAIEDYTSQADGCLSFSAGERCLLIKQSSGGWWYVNINGKEGWTPGEFWEEEKRVCYDSLHVHVYFSTFLLYLNNHTHLHVHVPRKEFGCVHVASFQIMVKFWWNFRILAYET